MSIEVNKTDRIVNVTVEKTYGKDFKYEDFTQAQLDALKGDKGDKGDPGSDANVTQENIESALGATPVITNNKDDITGNIAMFSGQKIVSKGHIFIDGSNIQIGEFNQIEDGTIFNTISGGGSDFGRNKIGANTKPYYNDFTPTGWADDVGYILETANYATIVGGYDNIVNQIAGSITGGQHCFIKYHIDGHSIIGGGSYHVISSGRSGIFSGRRNTITGDFTFSFIGGGDNNNITGSNSVISGGNSNTISKSNSVISGGIFNASDGDSSTISGGSNNISKGSFSTISGGANNIISPGGEKITIAGGRYNEIKGSNPTGSNINGGMSNVIFGDYNGISSGQSNTIGSSTTDGRYSGILSGISNIVKGIFSAILGGRSNQVNGDYSAAFGRRTIVNGNGVFALSDSVDEDYIVTASNKFSVKFANGYDFNGGKANFSDISVGTGASGSYTTADGKTVTVTDGIITSIV